MNIKPSSLFQVLRLLHTDMLTYTVSLNNGLKENCCMNAAIKWAKKSLKEVHEGVVFRQKLRKEKMLYGSKLQWPKPFPLGQMSTPPFPTPN